MIAERGAEMIRADRQNPLTAQNFT